MGIEQEDRGGDNHPAKGRPDERQQVQDEHQQGQDGNERNPHHLETDHYDQRSQAADQQVAAHVAADRVE